jgi:hypothetical protein
MPMLFGLSLDADAFRADVLKALCWHHKGLEVALG